MRPYYLKRRDEEIAVINLSEESLLVTLSLAVCPTHKVSFVLLNYTSLEYSGQSPQKTTTRVALFDRKYKNQYN
jgi:hypothetical protein